MAHSSRTWRGARTPQALKRVRQSARRRAILQPRRSAAKTLIARAVSLGATGNADETRQALTLAVSALDKAAKVGAIHPNQAARRKSRLMRKLNVELLQVTSAAAPATRATRAAGKTAAAKATKARVAASRATKAKGEQTAAGKARAALSRSTRESAPVEPTPAPTPVKSTAVTRRKAAAAGTTTRTKKTTTDS